MIVAISGTPGVGKTSVCNILGEHYPVLDLNGVIKKKKMYIGIDKKRDSLIADIEKLTDYVRDIRHDKENEILILDGHLSHLLQPDVTIVLRASSGVLMKRLENRFSKEKTEENIEAELMGVILTEATEMCELVYEIDTTGKRIEDVATRIEDIISEFHAKCD
jgi:adenylate kinase